MNDRNMQYKRGSVSERFGEDSTSHGCGREPNQNNQIHMMNNLHAYEIMIAFFDAAHVPASLSKTAPAPLGDPEVSLPQSLPPCTHIRRHDDAIFSHIRYTRIPYLS